MKTMWPSTKLTDLLQIKYPIVQGPFGGGYSSVALTATVSNCGGLGSFGAQSLTAAQILETTAAVREATTKPFAINLWVSDRDERVTTYTKEDYKKLVALFAPLFNKFDIPIPAMPSELGPTYNEQVLAVLEARPPVFSFVYGIPAKEILKECGKLNIKTIGAATTVDEALALQEAGVNVIVVSGLEAGGHRVSFLQDASESLNGLAALVPQVAAKVTLPIIAAGGIANGNGIAAALMLGADAVQIGTAFLACNESNASPAHKAILFTEAAKHTTLSKVFTGRLARGIDNELSKGFRSQQEQMAPFPIQALFVRALNTSLAQKGITNTSTFWCGQSAGLMQFKEAGLLFESLVNETEQLLR
ncbi:MAG TPA: nitronate monooxygenase [Flavisolibacter sp.]|nr:nitronate monooxygenase [Flavisolibacter sp.]